MPTLLAIGLIFFAATFIYVLAGFGNALVAMPLLVPIIGVHTASPLVAAVGIVSFAVLLVQSRNEITISSVWRLVVSSLICVPIGVWILSIAPAKLLSILLGGLCVLYALYRWFQFPMPAMKNPNWGFLFGALAGLCGGAVTAPGPPVVIYAETRPWSPDQFRANMNSFFIFTAGMVLISHAMAGNINGMVLRYWGISIPFMFLGLISGRFVNRFINRQQFRQLVLVLLIVIGLRLLVS